MIKQIPYRYKIPLDDIEKINISIEAYQKLIAFYEEWLEKNGPYDYVVERICALTSEYCEYLFAREFAREGARTFESTADTYSSVKRDFKKHFPKLEFIAPGVSNL